MLGPVLLRAVAHGTRQPASVVGTQDIWSVSAAFPDSDRQNQEFLQCVLPAQ
jgi:hypothetical protein